MSDNATPSTVLYVDPWRCRMWEMHDRASELLTADACREVIRSLKDHGQAIPVLGRRARNIPGIDYELIYGARRLFSAQHLNVKLAVQIVDIDDDTALRRMYIENAHRADLSPYERGSAFKRWLREGRFGSQNDLAEAVGVSVATVSRLLNFSVLPTAVIAAFPDPRQIREEWAVQLARNCKDAHTRSLVAGIARRISSVRSKQSPNSIFRQLMRAGHGERKKLAHDHVVREESSGEVLLRVRETDHNVMFIVPSQCMARANLAELIQCIRTIMARGNMEQRPKVSIEPMAPMRPSDNGAASRVELQ
jgi:ParB family chromosome partitioning protein